MNNKVCLTFMLLSFIIALCYCKEIVITPYSGPYIVGNDSGVYRARVASITPEDETLNFWIEKKINEQPKIWWYVSSSKMLFIDYFNIVRIAFNFQWVDGKHTTGNDDHRLTKDEILPNMMYYLQNANHAFTDSIETMRIMISFIYKYTEDIGLDPGSFSPDPRTFVTREISKGQTGVFTFTRKSFDELSKVW